jgi:hypothetical protein
VRHRLTGAVMASVLGRRTWLEALLPIKEVGLKSNVSDYLELVEAVYIDATTKCIADVSDLRDLVTIRSRVKDEGLSFLTITLPQFCKDFERSLALGCVDATLFKRFRRIKGAVMPAFLQGITRHIFDFETGKVFTNEYTPTSGGLSSDIPTLIESVRQICLTFQKVELPCTPQRVQKALDSFIAIEQHFETFSVPEAETAEFSAVSAVLWDNMVGDFTPSICVPKHGPGATAERISGNQKYSWVRWHDRLEPYFPIVDNGYPLGLPSDSMELKKLEIVPEDKEQPVRVVLVPKTLKGPRVIAIEPVCMQYVQQGIRDYLYDRIESYWLTKGHVNFRDQSINQSLAISSSKTGRLATIDLSDASDRVPRSLALEMFRANPDLRDSIDSCRSRKAQLPDGRLVSPLRKFASMGSALCFPVEAMYFYTVCVVALLKSRNLSASARNVFKVTRDLYVYGDDIIVPCANAIAVLEHLQKYNCKVNTNKTFVSGSFRESCGVDAYDGEPVTPVYLRHERPQNRRQSSQIISWVATANLFYLKGYWRTATLMFKTIERYTGSLPYVSENSEGLGRISFLGFRSIGRWNRLYQRIEINALVPSPVYRTDKLEGYGALVKCFHRMKQDEPKAHLAKSLEDYPKRLLEISDPTYRWVQDPFRSAGLEQTAQHGAVTLKRRWVPAQ